MTGRTLACIIFVELSTIKRTLNEIGIKVVIKPHSTSSKFFPSPKKYLSEMEISGTVYQVPCHGSKFAYVAKRTGS